VSTVRSAAPVAALLVLISAPPALAQLLPLPTPTGATVPHCCDRLPIYDGLNRAVKAEFEPMLGKNALATIAIDNPPNNEGQHLGSSCHTQPLIEWINRPTFQQADEIQRHVAR
jgi:hypothetical protein